MADFDIDNPVFEPDDWEENIGDDDVLSTLLHDDDGASPSERVTIDGTSTSVTLSLQQELLQTAVDDYYNAAAEAGLTPSLGRDPGKFELVDGQIRLKAYPNLDLVNKRSGRPLALSTLASRGGTKAIREDLGFADWAAKKSSLPAQAVEALQTTNLELGEAAAAIDSVELEDLGQTVTEVSDAIQRMETALTDTQIDEVLGTLDGGRHGGRHGYQYACPCVNRRRRHCNPTIPTTSPIGQRRSSRVGQKDAPSSWPCLGQTGWQGGCGATGDHWEHRLLAPQHLGEGRRMARRARVGSGGSRWRPALPGCDRNCQELLAPHKWH